MLYLGGEQDRLRKKLKNYFKLKIAFIVLLLMFAGVVYSNYNYMAFKLLIACNYIYTQTLDKLYEEAVGKENVRGYVRDFDAFVISAVTEKIRNANGDGYTYLYTPKKYTLEKSVEKSDAATTGIKQLTPDTSYVNIPNISKYTSKFILDNKVKLGTAKNLVIDLRNNYGGMLMDAYKVADLFTKKGDYIGYEHLRLPLLTHPVKSRRDGFFDYDNIIILQNKETASAAESLILALKKNLDNVTLIGTKTYGKGIGQITVPLLDGYAVKATILLVSGPDDVSINKKGIEPDIIYEGDDIVEFATNKLNTLPRK